MQVITKRKDEDIMRLRDVAPGMVYTYGVGIYHYIKTDDQCAVCIQDGMLIDVSTSNLKVRIVEAVLHVEY